GARILDQLGTVERRAEHGRVRDLAAQSAADAAFDHARDRIGAQRIGARLHGERRTAGEADAGVVAGTDLVVDAELGAHDARAGLQLYGILGAHAALARELTLAIRDDDLQP